MRGRVSASESLPGEVVVFHWKVAGQLFQALFENACHVATAFCGEALILRWGDAEAVERHLFRGRPADQAFIKERRQNLVEI